MVVVAAVLVRRPLLLGGRGGQGVVADGCGGLRGRQTDRWGREGVVGVEGVGGGRDEVVLGGG